MSDANKPPNVPGRTFDAKNPRTGTLVIEPPQPPANTSSNEVVPATVRQAGPHPLEGTVRIADIAKLVPSLPHPAPVAPSLPLPPPVAPSFGPPPVPTPREEEEPPMTRAIPFRLNGPPIPFSGAARPVVRDTERESQLPPRTPWDEVREHVPTAAHALSGTLVVEPAIPPTSSRAPDEARPLGQGEVAAPPASEPPPLPPPSDPWGLKLREVEPEPREPPPAPPPAPKVHERQEVRQGLYGRFSKGKP